MNAFLMESVLDPSGDTDVMLYVILSLIGLCLENTAYTKCYQTTMNWLQKRSGGTEEMSASPPHKAQGIVGMIWGGIFVLAGLYVFRPLFGFFGLLWALVAGVIILLHAWSLYSTRHVWQKRRTGNGGHRLEQLDTLKNAGLIDDREYRQRREKILRDLK